MKNRIVLFLLLFPLVVSAQTFKEWKQRAESGEVEAMHRMGNFYFDGDSVPQSYKIALQWYQKSAKYNYPNSLHNIAIFYLAGVEVPVDTLQAIHLLRRAAAQGFTGSMSGLAMIYRNGGTYINPDSCFYWEHKAAELGDARAQCMLSLYYERGFGVKKDLRKAFEWRLKAAEAGDADAIELVANDYQKGILVMRDYEKMLYWTKIAAERGRDNSIVWLGVLYQQGLYGVPIDKEKAFSLFQQAAMHGNAWGQLQLGECYRYGRGTTQDKEQARYWIKKAAEQGYQPAIEAWNEIDTGIDYDELRRKNEEYKQWFNANR